MFKYIKRYYFGWKVCRKYGITFSAPLSYKLSGRCTYGHSVRLLGLDWKVPCKIKLNLLQDNFYEVLLHELGHYMDHKATGFSWNKTLARVLPYNDITYGYYTGVPYKNYIFCEARASRYAMRLLKSVGKCRSKSLGVLLGKDAFASYTGKIPTELDLKFKLTVADLDYTMCRYISGK